MTSSFDGGDWEVLDLDANPTPGDPEAVASVASGLLNEAQLAQERSERLQSVADASGDLAMQGDYAPGFGQILADLPGPPGALAGSYQKSATALSGFADALAQAQAQSSAALERGTQADSMYRAALDEFSSVVPLEFSGTGVWRGLNEATAAELAGPMAEETENPELLDWAAEIGQYAGGAEDDRQAAIQMAMDAAQQRSEAEQQCAQAIQDATPEPLPGDASGDSAVPTGIRGGGGSGGSGGSGGTGAGGGGQPLSWDHVADQMPIDSTGRPLTAAEAEHLGLTPEQIRWRYQREAPFGMTPKQFQGFRSSLFGALREDGISDADADVRLQGSSARGFSGAHKQFLPAPGEKGWDDINTPEGQSKLADWPTDPADYPANRPFDAGHTLGFDKPSDYDMQISSDAMIGQAAQVHAAVGRDPESLINSKYGFLNKETMIDTFPALDRWKERWEQALGREVAPAVFPSAGPPDKSSTGVSSHFQDSDWIIFPPSEAG